MAHGPIDARNSHASQIVHDGDLSPRPERIVQTSVDPVALAMWGMDCILLVGAGTHALAIYDANRGEILSLVRVPAEPVARGCAARASCSWAARSAEQVRRC